MLDIGHIFCPSPMKTILTGASLACLMLAQATARASDLSDLINAGIQADSATDLNAIQEKIAVAQSKTTGRKLYPRITSRGVLERDALLSSENQSYSKAAMGLFLSQPLYDPVTLREREAQTSNSLQFRYRKDQRRQDVARTIALLFVAIVQAKMELRIAQTHLDISNRQLNEIKKMAAAGVVRRLSVLEAESRRGERETLLEIISQQISVLIIELNSLVQKKYLSPDNWTLPLLPTIKFQSQSQLRSSIEMKPEILDLKKQIESAEKKRDLVKARGLPKVDFVLSAEQSHDFTTPSQNFRAAFELNWVLYGSEISSEAMNEATLEGRKSAISYEKAISDANITLEKSIANLNGHHDILAVYDKEISIRKHIFDEHENGLKLQAVTTSSVLDNEEKLLDAEITKIKTIADFKRETINIMWSIGKLTPDNMAKAKLP